MSDSFYDSSFDIENHINIPIFHLENKKITNDKI